MKHICLLMVLCIGLAASARADQRVGIGASAPDFVGKTLSGEMIKLSDLRGKVVLLDFWASWCGPCREEMPFLVDFYRWNRKKGVEVLAVNIDDKAKNVRSFLSRLEERPGFPIVWDQKKAIPPMYALETMPTTFLIDSQGVVRFQHKGFKKSYEDALQEEVNTLLREQK